MNSPDPRHRSDDLLAAIIDSSDDAIISKDLNGTITSWNRGAEKIFGYTCEEMIGRSILVLIPSDRFPEEADILSRIRKGLRVEHYETVRRRKDGTLIDVSVTISPILDATGRVIGASKIARDVTESRAASRARVLLAAIVNSSDDAIVSKNLDGIITSWNEGAQRLFGYTPREIIGHSVLKLIPLDRFDEELAIMDRIRRGERVERFETVRVRKNGEHFPAAITISPLKDSRGNVIGASKIARDITEARLALEERDRTAREREQLLESERAARAQAEHANRMKDDFLATISHELRTPLNAIVGWTEVLADGGQGRDEVVQGIEIIKRNALMQAQLVEDLLDLGRISSGKMTLQVEHVDIVRVLREAVTSVQYAADLKNITIETHVGGDVRGGLLGDSKRLQQVMWNLLSNAIKFTSRGGKIEVNVGRNDTHFQISVADNGEGISSDFLPHIFERFRQADSSLTRKSSGLGIGLALVKELVEMHAGQVYAESAGTAQGSTFTVLLPVPITRIDAPARDTAAVARSANRLLEPDLSGIRVLAVDDDADSLEVVRRILTDRKATVITARSADEAVEAFLRERPDVVLSDIGMPDQDGYTLIKRIRELPGGKNVPAAALTALARPDDRMRALTAGYQTHLAKPVAASEMVAVIRSLASLR